MSERIALIEIDAYDPAIPGVKTLRYCTGLAYRTRPTETPANALYHPRVQDPGYWRTEAFTKPGDYGRAMPGEVVLEDADGALGASLAGLAFDGRKIVIREGVRGAAYPAGYVTLINGTVAGAPGFDWGRVTIRMADRMAELAKPIQPTLYAGTGSLEGGADIKGQPKPLVPARGSNIEPMLVSQAKVIYHVSAPIGSAAVSVAAVRDRGVPIAAGAGSYANTTDLLNDALAPAAGQYKVLATVADGTYIRLGSTPAGRLTCDALYGAAADRTHAQVIKRLLVHAGIASGDISAADVTALDTALPGEIELAIHDAPNAQDVVEQVARSAGCACYADETGAFRLLRWTAPSGSPVATLTQTRIEQMDLQDTTATRDAAPAWRVRLKYARNWTAQADADLAGDKTNPLDPVSAPGGLTWLAARAWLAEEWRTVESADAAVQTAHPKALTVDVECLLVDPTAAQAEADRLLALYKVRRDSTSIAVWLDQAQLNAVRLGAVVTAKLPRFGYTAGRLMRVAGVTQDRLSGKTNLMVWG